MWTWSRAHEGTGSPSLPQACVHAIMRGLKAQFEQMEVEFMDAGTYRLRLDPAMDPCPTTCALIWAEGIDSPEPSTEMPSFLGALVAKAQSVGEEHVPLETRQRVRRILRYGKYKPSGRGKPASEFLLRAALADEFPLVNPPVDVNNAISLETGLPGSIFDADLCGRDLLVRRGGPGEAYVFNPSGQTIDLQDLLLVCRQHEGLWEPCGNPVKDAMITKISPSTSSVIAVLYAPADESESQLLGIAQHYAELLESHCGALRVGCSILRASD